MFEFLLVVATILFLFGLLILKFTYSSQRMSSSETSTSNIKHLIQSGSRACHGMVRTESGKIQPDSKVSNSFLGSFF